jgi:hypothetical protein
MPSAAQIMTALQVVTILGIALTVCKLLISGLFRRYRIFFLFFLFRVPYFTWFLILKHTTGLKGGNGTSSFLYLDSFLYTEPLLILFYILVVVELYRVVLEKYKGLYTLGRWAMYGAVVISAVLSILSMLPKIASGTPEPSRILYYQIGVERGVQLALVIFIILIVGFLSRYPIPLSRNVVVHTGIYSVFFLSGSFVLLMRTVFGWKAGEDTAVNLVIATIECACTLAWFLLLSEKGEEAHVNLPPNRPDAEEKILLQLDSINQTLMRAAKK